MDEEQDLLVRVTVNYLFLAQFETFRASLLSLKQRNPALALCILQSIVKKGGQIEGVAWSTCISSPAQLTWLSLAELLAFQTPSSSYSENEPIWSLHPENLKLLTEFLLLVDFIKSKTLTESSHTDEHDENKEQHGAEKEEMPVVQSVYDGAAELFDVLSSFGMQRLQAEASMSDSNSSGDVDFTKAESNCLQRIARDRPWLVSALCDIIQRQVDFQRSKLANSVNDLGKDDGLQRLGDKPPCSL